MPVTIIVININDAIYPVKMSLTTYDALSAIFVSMKQKCNSLYQIFQLPADNPPTFASQNF